MEIQRLAHDGVPTGEWFTKTAPKGKVRAVILNQITCERFFEDYSSLNAAKSGTRRFSEEVVIRIYNDRGKHLFQAGEPNE
ncbi:hypothetical protein HYW59_03735 [Candidatus Kaiserbacteria bacterium]|nr:hypothetical protein [Candidatus Kaiserbacteria bacterium]